MNDSLRAAIDAANVKAGRSRQKVYAKKSYLKQTDAQVIDMLCERASEMMGATAAEYGAACEAMSEAVKVARKHRGFV